MNFASLFAGVGGFDLGFERAGMTCIGQVEIDRFAREVLARHWPHLPQYGDIRYVSGPDTFGPVDLLCGGFPCQDYSLAGRGDGLAGDRGALWWQFLRLIDECHPEWVVGENVPGLLSSNEGRDFGAIVGSLVELGYGVCWRILDAQYFGVGQRRRRVFIVGHSGGVPRPEVLDLTGHRSGHSASIGHSAKIAAGELARSLSGVGGGNDYGANKGTLIVTPEGKVRRLTPTECERLQGFPDGWTMGQTDGRRIRQMGNAVAVPVVEWIGKQIVKAE